MELKQFSSHVSNCVSVSIFRINKKLLFYRTNATSLSPYDEKKKKLIIHATPRIDAYRNSEGSEMKRGIYSIEPNVRVLVSANLFS